MSKIEWTDATWNPTRGCRRVSPGCENCYAEQIAYRFSGPGLPYEGLIQIGKQGPRWNGVGRFVPNTLDAPLHWRDPRHIFVNSMSDLFFERFSNEQIAAIFGVMAACPQHAFQVLTKRPGRAMQWFAWVKRESMTVNGPRRSMSEAAYCLAMAQRQCPDVKLTRNVDRTCARPWPLPNVWIGVSVEDQQRANERIPQLLRIPAAVRFVSYEPALGPVDFRPYLPKRWCDNCYPGRGHDSAEHRKTCRCGCHIGISWLIVGGESGPSARPFDLAWARSAVQQCQDAGVAVFVKQIGARPRETIVMEDREIVINGARNTYRAGMGTVAAPRVTAIGNNNGVPFTEYGLTDRKGGDWYEWPEDLRVREFPQ